VSLAAGLRGFAHYDKIQRDSNKEGGPMSLWLTRYDSRRHRRQWVASDLLPFLLFLLLWMLIAGWLAL
jgi:hypothetical protein